MQTLVVFELNTIILIHYGLVGIMPDGAKALSEPTLTYHQWGLRAILCEAIQQFIAITCLKVIYLFFNFPDVHCTHKVIHIVCALLLCFDGFKFISTVSTFSRVTSLASQWRHIVCLTVYLDADQRKQQSSAPLAIVRRIQRWPVNSLHKRTVARKMFQFNDVTMWNITMIWSRDYRLPTKQPWSIWTNGSH